MKKAYFLTVLLMVSLTTVAQIPANLALQEIVDMGGSNRPLTIRHSGDGSGRLFIVEQDGTIHIFDGSSILAIPFLDISNIVNSGGNEQGLLGLAFDPGYATNGYFYVNYTKSGSNSGDTIIERYSVDSTDPNIADAASGQVIMRIDQPFSNHNGGNILFGPDAYLYIGMGDGGSGGDPQNNAQNQSKLLGKMLRIDVSNHIYSGSFEAPLAPASVCGLDSSPGSYQIPGDNPYASDASKCSEIWAYGLRNPWRWSFDKLTGDLIIGDVGQNAYEEVNFQAATNNTAVNYGWRCREGAHDYDTSLCSGSDVYTEPVIDLPQNVDSGCSVMGGYVYRGPITAINGMYIFSDYCAGNMNFATPSAGTWPFTTWQNVGFGTYSFGEDEQGNVYVARNSKIYKFVLN
jgi:glucose/arabinose dehydrogenase